METSQKSSLRSRRYRGLLLPAIVGIPVILILLAVLYIAKPEALSPNEILAKDDWSDKELQSVLARSMSPVMTKDRKKEVMQHLSVQLRKRTPEQQDRIRCAAVVDAVGASLNQLRKMPEKEQKNMLATIQKRADDSYEAILKNSKRRQEVSKRMHSREMEAFTSEVNRVILAELTPAERVQFAPITNTWIKTMKIVGE